MKRLTLFTTALVMAVLAVLATHIRAQETNTDQRTIMTFSSAVELPGVTLEPGTYEFRLADTPTRNVVQVFLKQPEQSVGGKPMGQWTFIPAERPRASDETVVMFKEAREGSTPAIQYWYFPNERIGKEFIYPKDQAEKIAARTGQSVRTEEGPVTASADASNASASASATAAAASNEAARPAPEADAVAANAAAAIPAEPVATQPTAPESTVARAEVDAPQTPAVDPEPRPVGTSGVAEAPQTPAPAAAPRQAQQPAPESQPAQASADLPKTASPLPLTGLIGLMSLAGAATLRFLRG